MIPTPTFPVRSAPVRRRAREAAKSRRRERARFLRVCPFRRSPPAKPLAAQGLAGRDATIQMLRVRLGIESPHHAVSRPSRPCPCDERIGRRDTHPSVHTNFVLSKSAVRRQFQPVLFRSSRRARSRSLPVNRCWFVSGLRELGGVGKGAHGRTGDPPSVFCLPRKLRGMHVRHGGGVLFLIRVLARPRDFTRLSQLDEPLCSETLPAGSTLNCGEGGPPGLSAGRSAHCVGHVAAQGRAARFANDHLAVEADFACRQARVGETLDHQSHGHFPNACAWLPHRRERH
jgi:hypothetical protein